MALPTPAQMMDMIRALPAAAPLLTRLDGRAGVYLVGGMVRDLLLGRAPLDLDLLVEGDALALARALGGEIRAHGRFGTGTVALDGHVYDLASARRERYPRPGALPEVAPAGLEEDLDRRDFTVNALAVPVTGSYAGTLIAVAHGLEDLERRQLRILHPDSFIDDPTRLLRLVRYASRLGFEVEPDTAAAARTAIAGGALGTVSGQRVGAELRLLAAEADPVTALASLAPWGLDRAIHPSLGLEDPDLARRALALLPADGRRDRVALATAARGVPAPELHRLLDDLGFTAADREAIVAAATRAPALAYALAGANRPSEIAAVAAGVPVEAVALAGALGPRDAAARWLDGLRDVRLHITGEDLLAAGVAPGPSLGRGLAAALAAKLDGRADDRGAELDVALAAARQGD